MHHVRLSTYMCVFVCDAKMDSLKPSIYCALCQQTHCYKSRYVSTLFSAKAIITDVSSYTKILKAQFVSTVRYIWKSCHEMKAIAIAQFTFTKIDKIL